MKRESPALPAAAEIVEPTLVWQRPDGSTVDIFIPLGRTVTIGRAETNSVVVDSAWVSKAHAAVRFAGSHYLVEDLGSANGTQVNDAPIASSVLTLGDAINIGDHTFTFVDRATQPARRGSTSGPRSGAGKLIRLGLVGLVTAVVMLVALRSLLPSEPAAVRPTPPPSSVAPLTPADTRALASQVTGESARVREIRAAAKQAGVDVADALYDEGVMQHRVERFFEAAQLFAAALETRPDHPTAKQRLDAALDALHRTVTELAAEGDRLASQLRWAQAIATWEKVIDALPPTDSRVADAKANIEIARRRLSGNQESGIGDQESGIGPASP